MDAYPRLLQRLDQIAHRFLSGTQDHGVTVDDGGPVALVAAADVQSAIVDAFVVDAADLFHPLRLDRRAMYPAGGLTQALAEGRRLPLQQDDIAGSGRGTRGGQLARC